jgi:hypothetical protein
LLTDEFGGIFGGDGLLGGGCGDESEQERHY